MTVDVLLAEVLQSWSRIHCQPTYLNQMFCELHAFLSLTVNITKHWKQQHSIHVKTKALNVVIAMVAAASELQSLRDETEHTLNSCCTPSIFMLLVFTPTSQLQILKPHSSHKLLCLLLLAVFQSWSSAINSEQQRMEISQQDNLWTWYTFIRHLPISTTSQWQNWCQTN